MTVTGGHWYMTDPAQQWAQVEKMARAAVAETGVEQVVHNHGASVDCPDEDCVRFREGGLQMLARPEEP